MTVVVASCAGGAMAGPTESMRDSTLPAVVAATESGRVGLVRWNDPSSSNASGLPAGTPLLMHAENSAINTLDLDATTGQVRNALTFCTCNQNGRSCGSVSDLSKRKRAQ